jgi:hypothetical protein
MGAGFPAGSGSGTAGASFTWLPPKCWHWPEKWIMSRPTTRTCKAMVGFTSTVENQLMTQDKDGATD